MCGAPLQFVHINATEFDSWESPDIVERGTHQHQLYSQITWRFYDIFLGIVMTLDAEDTAGHVHCMLSWSNDTKNWQWVDPAGLGALKEFIPAGKPGSFDSHVCFAAHSPLKMPDGSSRVYYMGGDGPHSGARNSSFALATLPADRFAGMTSARSAEAVRTGADTAAATAVSRAINITGAQMLVTVDIEPGGSFTIGVDGSADFHRSEPVTATGTDLRVEFKGHPAGLTPLIGQQHKLALTLHRATVYTVGFEA